MSDTPGRALPPEDELEDSRMPLVEHLDDLRKVLVRALVALVLGMGITYSFSDRIVLFLEEPLLRILPKEEARLYFTGITDKFFVYLKVSALASLALTCPYTLYQIWKFVAPGLYRHERRWAGPFVALGTAAFFLGMSFAYYIVIPYGYKFLIEFGSPTDQAIITLKEYFGLTIKMLLGLGLVFELPVVMILLGKLGILQADVLARHRRHAFVGIATLSAVITPSPDAFTMLLVMGPLWLLYEVSIVGIRWLGRPILAEAEESPAAPKA